MGNEARSFAPFKTALVLVVLSVISALGLPAVNTNTGHASLQTAIVAAGPFPLTAEHAGGAASAAYTWEGTDRLYFNDFSSGSFGDWLTTGGTWAVEGGAGSISSNGSALRSVDARNFHIEAEVQVLTGRFAGLLALWHSDGDYLFFTIDTQEGQGRLVRVARGSPTPLTQASYQILPKAWYKLRLEVSGSYVVGYINDALVASATVADASPGMVGLKGGYATPGYNTNAHFDDFTVYRVPRVRTVTPEGTTISINDGDYTAPFQGLIADNAASRSFISWEPWAQFNYTVGVAVEGYYQISLHACDLGGDNPASKIMIASDLLVIGRQEFNDPGSGDATSCRGLDVWHDFGTARLPAGLHTLHIINNLNSSVSSENLLHLRLTKTSIPTPAPLMRFLVASDLHYNKTGGRGILSGVAGDGNMLLVDSDRIVRTFIAQVNGMSPRPDYVILAGDLITGNPADYGPLKVILDGLTVPYLFTIGSHDSPYRSEIASLWGSQVPEFTNSSSWYYKDLGGARFIFLDSGDDQFPREELDWLNQTLETDQTVFAFIHHPLVKDAFHLSAMKAVASALAHKGNVAAVFNGHNHRNYIIEQGGLLHVSVTALIEFPMQFTQVTVYPLAFDINRIQLDDVGEIKRSWSTPNSNFSIGETDYITRNSVSLGIPGFYAGVGLNFDREGNLASQYDRPVLGHALLGSSLGLSVSSTGGGSYVILEAYRPQEEWGTVLRMTLKSGGGSWINLTDLVRGVGFAFLVDGVRVADQGSQWNFTGPSFSIRWSNWSARIFELVGQGCQLPGGCKGFLLDGIWYKALAALSGISLSSAAATVLLRNRWASRGNKKAGR